MTELIRLPHITDGAATQRDEPFIAYPLNPGHNYEYDGQFINDACGSKFTDDDVRLVKPGPIVVIGPKWQPYVWLDWYKCPACDEPVLLKAAFVGPRNWRGATVQPDVVHKYPYNVFIDTTAVPLDKYEIEVTEKVFTTKEQHALLKHSDKETRETLTPFYWLLDVNGSRAALEGNPESDKDGVFVWEDGLVRFRTYSTRYIREWNHYYMSGEFL